VHRRQHQKYRISSKEEKKIGQEPGEMGTELVAGGLKSSPWRGEGESFIWGGENQRPGGGAGQNKGRASRQGPTVKMTKDWVIFEKNDSGSRTCSAA